MKILGLDPGTVATGFGIVGLRGRAGSRLECCGVWRPPAALALAGEARLPLRRGAARSIGEMPARRRLGRDGLRGQEHRLGAEARARPRRPARRRRPRGRPRLRVRAAPRQEGARRLRQGREGAGPGDGPVAARPPARPRSPSTPPTPWRSRSATSTPRRALAARLGRASRVAASPRGLLASARRMSFQGSIQELPVPDIIQLVSVSGKTGMFTLVRGAERGYIYLKNGQIVHAELGGAHAARRRSTRSRSGRRATSSSRPARRPRRVTIDKTNTSPPHGGGAAPGRVEGPLAQDPGRRLRARSSSRATWASPSRSRRPSGTS